MNDGSVSLQRVSEQYRVADLLIVPAGGNVALVTATQTNATQLMHMELVSVLTQCRPFKTIDEHVQAYCADRHVSNATKDRLRKELGALAQRDYFISRTDTRAALQAAATMERPPRIATVGFPTCDRVAPLQRCLTSYITQCQSFGRSPEFVVVDDSTKSTTRQAYRQMLTALAEHHGVSISYAGLEEKIAFAERLAEAGEIPSDVVRFACVGADKYEHTTVGANRNALLLHTVGDMLFMADDDTTAQVAAAPDASDEIIFDSQGLPLDVWFFPDRNSALQSVTFGEHDLLSLHEQWLGRNPLSCLSRHRDDGTAIFERIEPRLAHSLRAKAHTVRMTMNGTVGDSSWDNHHYHLFQQAATFQRLTSSEQAYEVARSSREVVQAMSRAVITKRSDRIFGMCLGLDNRELLPPFTPLGRAEDVAFGLMLSKCFDTACATHVPWIVPHLPDEKRSSAGHMQMFQIGFNSWIPSCISQADVGLVKTPAERLRKLGEYLQELGRLSIDSFVKFALAHCWKTMSTLITGLEERLRTLGSTAPAYWVQDVHRYISVARQQALAPVTQLCTLENIQLLQTLICQLGDVFVWWPTMVETARVLRANNYRLASKLT